MSYQYNHNDNIFDIESLSNLYVDTHYFPARHQVDIYYLSDVSGYRHFNADTVSKIKKQILAKNYGLRKLDEAHQLKINFYDLTIPRSLIRYCKFWGLTPNKPSSLNYVNSRGKIRPLPKQTKKRVEQGRWYPNKWIYPKSYERDIAKNKIYAGPKLYGLYNMAWPYYTVKKTDPYYNPKKYGVTMGFNSDNYDLTMIAVFFGHLVHNHYAQYYLNQAVSNPNQLPTDHWKSFDFLSDERHDLIARILKPEFLRHYNDLLFTKYKKSMPQLLEHQPDLHSVDDPRDYFELIDNPAQYIYKGWLTSRRYLDVANLNEHMKFVPLKRIAAMKGWQILESKNVTANTKFVRSLAQIEDLIAYNNSDVQVTKQVFELPEYQDALTLRKILLKKFPQLTYSYNKVSAFKRYYKRYYKRHPKEIRAKYQAKKCKFDKKLATVRSRQLKIDAHYQGLISQAHSPFERIPLLNKMFSSEERCNTAKSIQIIHLNQFKNGTFKVNKYNAGHVIHKYRDQITSIADPQDTTKAPNHLRFSPLTEDASSAKLISNVIAPYHSMKDWPDIEFEFPDPRALKIFKAKHPEIKLRSPKPFNVLTDTLNWTKEVDAKFGLSKYPPADEKHVLDKHHSLYKTFKPIYRLYRHVEGHNANGTLEKYAGKRKLYNIKGQLETVGPSINMTRLLHETNGNIPYLHRDGSSTGTTAVFSYGGIHGVEFKLGKYKQDYRDYLRARNVQDQLKDKFKSSAVQTSLFNTGNAPKKKDSASAAYHARVAKVEIDGRKKLVSTKPYLKGSGSRAQWKDLTPPRLYKHPSKATYKLNDRYSYVSVDPVSHEDFSGYYPMLISRLGIMWPHDEPKDTYHQLYVERLHLKHELKKYTKNSPKWNDINKKQLLRKLLLNSASGAGDAKFFNTIRMNNKIISMRIMGQLFTWRMAQSVCLADKNLHAKVTSSNTDGVYLAGLPSKINDVALQKAVKPLSLFIGPVPLSRFVSKDANNRAEITNYGTKEHPKNRLTEAKGATLNAWQGPSVTATVNHPAIIDYTLAKYLSYQPNPCNSDFNPRAAMKLINEQRRKLSSDDPAKRAEGLIYFQWVIASNPNKHRYPFLMPEGSVDGEKWTYDKRAIPIAHTNRLFLVKEGGPRGKYAFTNQTLLLAVRQKITRKAFEKIEDSKKKKPLNEPHAEQIFDSWGDTSLPDGSSDGYQENDHVGRLAKLPDMPEHQNIVIENHSLYELPAQEVKELERELDYHAYLNLVAKKFHTSWDNNN